MQTVIITKLAALAMGGLIMLYSGISNLIQPYVDAKPIQKEEIKIDREDFQFHENVDDMFAPFLKFDKDEEYINEYMYMYHNKKGQYFYKNSLTRKYIVIDKDGKLIDGTPEKEDF